MVSAKGKIRHAFSRGIVKTSGLNRACHDYKVAFSPQHLTVLRLSVLYVSVLEVVKIIYTFTSENPSIIPWAHAPWCPMPV